MERTNFKLIVLMLAGRIISIRRRSVTVVNRTTRGGMKDSTLRVVNLIGLIRRQYGLKDSLSQVVVTWFAFVLSSSHFDDARVA